MRDCLRDGGMFTLGVERVLALLILGDFVRLVLLALLAVSPAGFRYVHLGGGTNKTNSTHKAETKELQSKRTPIKT